MKIRPSQRIVIMFKHVDIFCWRIKRKTEYISTANIEHILPFTTKQTEKILSRLNCRVCEVRRYNDGQRSHATFLNEFYLLLSPEFWSWVIITTMNIRTNFDICHQVFFTGQNSLTISVRPHDVQMFNTNIL